MSTSTGSLLSPPTASWRSIVKITLRTAWTFGWSHWRARTLFLQTPFNELVPRISPMAAGFYLSLGPLRSSPFPSPSGKWQISTEGQPVWERNGHSSFAPAIKSWRWTSRLSFPSRQALPGLFYVRHGGPPEVNFDVTPDGQRFLMLKATEQQPQSEIRVVLNWFEELKRLVPTN